MSRLLRPALALVLLSAGVLACDEDVTGDASDGPAFDLTVAPLLLPGVTDVEYTAVIKNASDTVLTTVSFSSAGYGDGTGFARYVAPCDADAGQQPNKVELTVDGVFTGSPATPLDVSLPTVFIREENCTADTSTTVSFDIYGVQSAGQGFFDILIGFESIYCSAKLDCDADPAMFPGSPAGMVLGFVCAAGNAAEENTTLYMNNLTLDCGGAGTATIDPNYAGNLPAGNIVGTSSLVDAVTVSRGEDSLAATDQLFWNVAIGLDATAVAATCDLTVQATATSNSLGAGPSYTTVTDYPFIDWNLTVTNGALACSAHPVGATDVTVAFPAAGGTSTFAHEYAGPVEYVFVTSETYTPGTDFDSLADADLICQATAMSAGLEGDYAAWLSDSTTDAVSRISATGPFLLVDGTVVADDLADLTDGTLDNAIGKDQNGATVAAGTWSGTLTDGTVAGTTCVDWTSSDAGDTGANATTVTTSNWSGAGTGACGTPLKLICMPAL